MSSWCLKLCIIVRWHAHTFGLPYLCSLLWSVKAPQKKILFINTNQLVVPSSWPPKHTANCNQLISRAMGLYFFLIELVSAQVMKWNNYQGWERKVLSGKFWNDSIYNLLILESWSSRAAIRSNWGEFSWPYNSGICQIAAPYDSPSYSQTTKLTHKKSVQIIELFNFSAAHTRK